MKKILIMLSVGLSLPMMLNAADYSWLTFTMTDNTEISVAAENLALDYSDGNLKLKSPTVDRTFSVTDIRSMRFTGEPSAIAGVESEEQTMAGEYFTVTGERAGYFATPKQARQELPSGVYILNTSERSIKIIF